MDLFNPITESITSLFVSFASVDDGSSDYGYDDERRKILMYGQQGMELSLWTFGLTILLELWSVDTVQKVLNQKGAGWSLYVAAIMANIRNHFFLGVPIYTAAAYLFCYDGYSLLDDDDNGVVRYTAHLARNTSIKDVHNTSEGQSIGVTSSDRLTSVASILLVQSVCFYAAHRAFHSNPNWYKHHRFHHRFNTYVPPMAANAVSPVEYIFAYILPFTLILPVLKVDSMSLRIVISIVSVTNLMIHTPKLSAASEKFMPEWLVSTEDHLEHHRKLNTKYAAPTFNVDFFVDWIEQRFCRGNGGSGGGGSNGGAEFDSNVSSNGLSAIGTTDPTNGVGDFNGELSTDKINVNKFSSSSNGVGYNSKEVHRGRQKYDCSTGDDMDEIDVMQMHQQQKTKKLN